MFNRSVKDFYRDFRLNSWGIRIFLPRVFSPPIFIKLIITFSRGRPWIVSRVWSFGFAPNSIANKLFASSRSWTMFYRTATPRFCPKTILKKTSQLPQLLRRSHPATHRRPKSTRTIHIRLARTARGFWTRTRLSARADSTSSACSEGAQRNHLPSLPSTRRLSVF